MAVSPAAQCHIKAAGQPWPIVQQLPIGGCSLVTSGAFTVISGGRAQEVTVLGLWWGLSTPHAGPQFPHTASEVGLSYERRP